MSNTFFQGGRTIFKGGLRPPGYGRASKYFAIVIPALQVLTLSQLQSRLVICSASHRKPNRCTIFSFVDEVLGREGTFLTLLVNANLNIKMKQQTDLKTQFTVKIGGAAVSQCLRTSHH